MLGGHGSTEVGGADLFRLVMTRQPFDAEAVRHSRERGVQAQGLGVAKAAVVIMTRGVEAGVQAGLDAPVPDVGFQPPRRRQFGPGPAGDQQFPLPASA